MARYSVADYYMDIAFSERGFLQSFENPKARDNRNVVFRCIPLRQQ